MLGLLEALKKGERVTAKVVERIIFFVVSSVKERRQEPQMIVEFACADAEFTKNVSISYTASATDELNYLPPCIILQKFVDVPVAHRSSYTRLGMSEI